MSENPTGLAHEQAQDLAALEQHLNDSPDLTLPGQEQEPEKEPDIPTADVLKMVLTPIADIFCPAWNLKGAEIEQLAEAYAPVLDKYMPGGMSFGVELNAVLVTALIIGPRMKTPRKPEQDQEPKNSETEKPRGEGRNNANG